jgi:hypothetical protein
MSLQQGSQGKAVADVRQALRRAGVTAADRAGVFGPNTANAVRTIQSQRGLPATGVVDQQTWKALGLRGSVPDRCPSHAKQIVLGRAPDYGHVVHIAAQSPPDLEAALRDLSAVANVTGVVTLATRLTG